MRSLPDQLSDIGKAPWWARTIGIESLNLGPLVVAFFVMLAGFVFIFYYIVNTIQAEHMKIMSTQDKWGQLTVYYERENCLRLSDTAEERLRCNPPPGIQQQTSAEAMKMTGIIDKAFAAFSNNLP